MIDPRQVCSLYVLMICSHW